MMYSTFIPLFLIYWRVGVCMKQFFLPISSLNLLPFPFPSDLSTFISTIIIPESTILPWSRAIKARSTLNSQMVTYLGINRV